MASSEIREFVIFDYLSLYITIH